MYRYSRAAAASRLRPAAPLRAWASPEALATGPDPPRRRYRARPQDLEPPRSTLWALPLLPLPARLPALSPPEGLEGDITTVDGHREDDIAVRDSPAAATHLLLRPPGPLLAPPGPPRRPPPSMEEHLAVMHQKLQHELPNFFLKIPDYGLYAPDVEFINHLLHLHTRGRPMYQVAVALCRAAAWGYFASLRLEVLALTRHPEDWSIRARWRLTGLPLHLCLLRFYRRDKRQLLRSAPRHRVTLSPCVTPLSPPRHPVPSLHLCPLRFYRRDKRQLLRSYDAFSTFFLNAQGLIRCHRVDKVMPAPTAVTEAKKLLVAAAAAAALSEPGAALRLALKPPATSGDT